MKHVFIYTQQELYDGTKNDIEETNLEREYGDKSFLVFEHHNEVTPHKDSVHAFIGTESDNIMIVAE